MYCSLPLKTIATVARSTHQRYRYSTSMYLVRYIFPISEFENYYCTGTVCTVLYSTRFVPVIRCWLAFEGCDVDPFKLSIC